MINAEFLANCSDELMSVNKQELFMFDLIMFFAGLCLIAHVMHQLFPIKVTTQDYQKELDKIKKDIK